MPGVGRFPPAPAGRPAPGAPAGRGAPGRGPPAPAAGRGPPGRGPPAPAAGRGPPGRSPSVRPRTGHALGRSERVVARTRGTIVVAAAAAGHALRRGERVVAGTGTARTRCRTTLACRSSRAFSLGGRTRAGLDARRGSGRGLGSGGYRGLGGGGSRSGGRGGRCRSGRSRSFSLGFRSLGRSGARRRRRTGRCRAGRCLGADAGASDFEAAGASGKALRSFRTTGASIVDEAERTNSPSSCSLVTASLEVIPSSLASSCTRTLATFLLSRSAPSQARTVYFLLRASAANAAERPIAERNKVVIVAHSSLGTHRVSISFLTRFQVGRLLLRPPGCPRLPCLQ